MNGASYVPGVIFSIFKLASEESYMANIYNKSRQELGYTNVTNQYIELASRKLLTSYGAALQTNLTHIAREEGLSISVLCQDFGLRMAQGYIVSVYTCLDRFLVDYRNLPGSPTYQEKGSKDSSLLEPVFISV